MPGASFVPGAGGLLKKTNTELLPFLAAISVRGQGLETGSN